MKSTSGIYFSRLDHLRFLAALMVLGWHSIHMYGLPTSIVPKFWPLSIFEEGHSGVSLFMTLSGFIFYALAEGEDVRYWGFIRNRVLRIAPLFILWVYFWYVTTPLDPGKTLLAVFGLLNFPNTIDVGWTVVVEFQFYLLFPFLLIFARTYGSKYLLSLVVLAIAIRLATYLTIGPVQPMAYWTILGRMDQFALGMFSFELYRRRFELLSSPLALVVVITIWILLTHVFNQMGGLIGTERNAFWIVWPTIEGIIYGALIVTYLAAKISIPRQLDRILAWLGTLSFSLYMNHIMALAIARELLTRIGINGGALGLDAMVGISFLVCLPLTVIMSTLTYYVIERPFLSLRKNYRVSAGPHPSTPMPR